MPQCERSSDGAPLAPLCDACGRRAHAMIWSDYARLAFHVCRNSRCWATIERSIAPLALDSKCAFVGEREYAAALDRAQLWHGIEAPR